MCLFGIALTEAPCLGDRPPEGFVERIPARESLQRFQSTDPTADSKSNHVPLAAVRRSLTCKQKSNVANAEKRPQEGCAAVPCAGNVVRNHRFCGQAPRYSFTKSVERKTTEFARWELERLDHTKDGQNEKTRLHTVRDGQQQLDIPILRPEAKGRGSGGVIRSWGSGEAGTKASQSDGSWDHSEDRAQLRKEREKEPPIPFFLSSSLLVTYGQIQCNLMPQEAWKVITRMVMTATQKSKQAPSLCVLIQLR